MAKYVATQSCKYCSTHFSSRDAVEEKPAADAGDDAKDDATFFKVLDRVDIEGHVLDVSFVQKTVVVLSCVATEGANTNDSVKHTGDQGSSVPWVFLLKIFL